MDIVTYAADGRRLRGHSQASIERLEGLDKVIVQRNRKGRILCAQFRPQSGANPVHATAHAGTRYSFLVAVGENGHHVWQHKDLLSLREVERLFGELDERERERRDLYVRAVFRAVPLSCMPPKKKVVSIDSYQRPVKKGNPTARIAA